MTKPAASRLADELHQTLGPWADLDEDNAWTALRVCSAIAVGGDLVDQIANPTVEDRGPWETALDIDHTPAALVPWLAQWVGVDPKTLVGFDEPDQRQLVRDTPAQRRGTPDAQIGAVKPVLTGAQHAVLRERDGGAYRQTFITYEAETPADLVTFTGQVAPLVFVEGQYSPTVLKRLVSQKPAGIRLTYRVDPGWSIGEMETAYDGQTIADLESDFATVGALESNLPA